MEKEQLPGDAVECFSQLFAKLKTDEKSLKKYRELRARYLNGKQKFLKVKKGLCSVGRALGVCDETIFFGFLLLCLDEIKNRYGRRGLSDELFYTTFADLKYKLLECRDVKGVWGTFVATWYDGFYKLERFTYGRFQYEVTKYAWLKYDKYGVKLRKRTRVLNFHIPSSGEPLTYETRLASYKLAYEAYKSIFGGGSAVFVCASWLLYREHYDFLPPESNIIDFMKDFDIIKSISLPVFGDAWRIFGADAKKPPETLPENTSLQRAYKKRLAEKKHGGAGYGIIVFDGERILTRSN